MTRYHQYADKRVAFTAEEEAKRDAKEEQFRLDHPEGLEHTRARKIARLKLQTSPRLSETDWYITRKSETDKAIPDAVTTYRGAVRKAIDDAEIEINKMTDEEKIRGYRITWPDKPE